MMPRSRTHPGSARFARAGHRGLAPSPLRQARLAGTAGSRGRLRTCRRDPQPGAGGLRRPRAGNTLGRGRWAIWGIGSLGSSARSRRQAHRGRRARRPGYPLAPRSGRRPCRVVGQVHGQTGSHRDILSSARSPSATVPSRRITARSSGPRSRLRVSGRQDSIGPDLRRRLACPEWDSTRPGPGSPRRPSRPGAARGVTARPPRPPVTAPA